MNYMAVKLFFNLIFQQRKISCFFSRLRTFSVNMFNRLLICTVLPVAISPAFAAPTGGNIIGGSGSINQSGSTTTIQQNTQSLAIDWKSFNVKQNETVNFLQPGASAIALNHIVGNNASQIFGQINANGQVVLVNPNGIFFGSTASVNVGGLIASGLDISASDFMNGDYFWLFRKISG